MALFREDLTFNAEAAKDLSSFQHRFMKLDTGGKVTNNATAGESVTFGVLQNNDASGTGQAARVAFLGRLRVVAGTTSGNAGDRLTLAASGKVQTHTEGTGTRQIVVGLALEDYSTGVTFTALVPAPYHRGEI